MTEAPTVVSPLRRRMIDDMTPRNLLPATQRSYLHSVTKFSDYFGRSPDRLGLEDVRAYQVRLVAQGISWPVLNQTVCPLRFLYGVTLDRQEIPERIAYARTTRKLPAILSAEEVVRFLEAVPSDLHPSWSLGYLTPVEFVATIRDQDPAPVAQPPRKGISNVTARAAVSS